mmetsp:Transcript_6358/g.15709  ORF Transcript_6358/g.15709 Transcript_6358/m.15709 type:complete len:216 (+) Transcript_6358:921-1568(+)
MSLTIAVAKATTLITMGSTEPMPRAMTSGRPDARAYERAHKAWFQATLPEAEPRTTTIKPAACSRQKEHAGSKLDVEVSPSTASLCSWSCWCSSCCLRFSCHSKNSGVSGKVRRPQSESVPGMTHTRKGSRQPHIIMSASSRMSVSKNAKLLAKQKATPNVAAKIHTAVHLIWPGALSMMYGMIPALSPPVQNPWRPRKITRRMVPTPPRAGPQQ